MFGWFTSAKNIIMAVVAAVVGGYVLKQKYDALQAESKLASLEGQIAKTNVVVAKEIAVARATSKAMETTAHIDLLRDLKVEKKKVLKEMDEIETQIEIAKVEKAEVKGRKRGKSIKVSN